MSVSTDNALLRSDRQRAPRGSTPLLDIDPSRIPYSDRTETHLALLARGATRLMCETFQLDYSPASGIVAWADEELFAEFSGPAMQHGDRWKIYLGRCLLLEADDNDGRAFIEELVEEAMLFPTTRSDEVERWETVLEASRVWVTRPTTGIRANSNSDINSDAYMSDEDPHEKYDNALSEDSDDDRERRTRALFLNEYEESELDDDDMDVEPNWSSHAHLPDRTWDSNSDLDVDACADADENSGGASSNDVITVKSEERDDKGVEAVPNGSDDSMSSADSDFDDDEVLSGDEGLLEYAKLLNTGPPYW